MAVRYQAIKLLIILVSALIYGAAKASDTSTTSSLGQFAAETAAEKELERMLNGPDEKIDLALANFLIATDIPAYKNVSREDYMRQIDLYCAQTSGLIEQAKRNPMIAGPLSDPNNLMFAFCSGVIGIKFSYAEEFRDPNMSVGRCRVMYQNPDNIFLVGLLKNKHGSCVSMPLIYIVIAQKLGYPVHLVTIGQHYFVRWEQPGFRMNIEPTIVEKVAFTPDESAYFESESLKPKDIEGTYYLRNMTNREVVGNLFHARAKYYDAVDAPPIKIVHDIDRADYLAPQDPMTKQFIEVIKGRIRKARQAQAKMKQQQAAMDPHYKHPAMDDPLYYARRDHPEFFSHSLNNSVSNPHSPNPNNPYSHGPNPNGPMPRSQGR